jgi:hypothetical protein
MIVPPAEISAFRPPVVRSLAPLALAPLVAAGVTLLR